MKGNGVTDSAVLLLACPDRPGIVAQVTTFLFQFGANILRAEQSDSRGKERFHLRIHFDCQGQKFDLGQVRQGFGPLAEDLHAEWSIRDHNDRPNVAIMVSKESHCLLDILSRWRVGDLPAKIVAIISNHQANHDIARAFDVPFHHLPVTQRSKPAQERALDDLLTSMNVELVVLAKYMQILSDSFVENWKWKVINIHHSFLPAFPGARPYHQAMERGVKLIGATAHYVTAELDDGPIIWQGVTSTSHRDEVADFIRRGREVESQVLAAAVRAHLEHRVIVTGPRTVVFE